MLNRSDSVMLLSPAILQSRYQPFANFGLHCSVQPNRHADIFAVAIPHRPRWQFIWLNTKCLKIEIENQVATIPNGGVPCGVIILRGQFVRHERGQSESVQEARALGTKSRSQRNSSVKREQSVSCGHDTTCSGREFNRSVCVRRIRKLGRQNKLEPRSVVPI